MGAGASWRALGLKTVGAHSTRSLKISGCKRWCPKDLRVRAPAAPVLTHSMRYLCTIFNILLYFSHLIFSLSLQTKQRFLHRESFSLACFWVIQPFFMAIVTTFQPVFRPNCLSFFTFYWKNVEITENYQILGVSQKFCKVVGIKGGFISKRIIIFPN